MEHATTDHYKLEYIEDFVDKWDQLIDWDARHNSEGQFFMNLLKERGVKKVLDVATGTGYHSVRMVEEGFEVTSADGSPNMLAKAFENGRKRGHILRTVQSDWRWLSRDIHDKYDAVICLGNSFTHLFSERDRRKSLAEFYSCLRQDGVLILDQRNYDALLSNGYANRGNYYYCGKDVEVTPTFVDENIAKFQYTFPDKTDFQLSFYPLRRDYVRQLMFEVGFQQVQTLGDFKETDKHETPDFFIHCAEKNYGDDYGGEHA